MRLALLPFAVFVAATVGLGGGVLAVQPNEVLADPALEARARTISSELRCLVCQNQSIDDSDAPLAADLRKLVRERLTAKDSDAQVLDYIVSRYGEFVLLNPRLEPQTILLWATPLIVLLAGALLAWKSLRGVREGQSAKALSDDERARLAALLGKEQ
jgi:cytochrome c-type biogenesis protein CcmH